MPIKNLVGVESKACINGLTKNDVKRLLELKNIDESIQDIYSDIDGLDERVTDLESDSGDGSNNNWVDAHYESGSNINFSPYFDITTHLFKKDVILYYYTYDSDPNNLNEKTGYVFIPKGSHPSQIIFKIDIAYKFTNTQTSETHIQIGHSFATGESLRRLVTKNNQYNGVYYDSIILRESIIDFNLTNGTITTINQNFGIDLDSQLLKLFYNDV